MALGLGRGLEALIPTTSTRTTRSAPPTPGGGVLQVDVKKISANPHQPRKRFAVPELENLASSIKEHGILEPLLVSPSGTKPDQYILVAGERRLRAASLAGLSRVPVIIRSTDEQEKVELALIENIQREDLNPLEEAQALRKLLRNFNLSQAKVAQRVGRSRSSVANTLRLLDLAAEVQRALLENEISEGHAKVILSLSNSTHQIEVLSAITSQKLSVRQTEILIREYQRRSSERDGKLSLTKKVVDPEREKIAKELSQALGARVDIVSSSRGGKIVIEYFSHDERKRIVDNLLKESDNPDSRVATDASRARSGFSV